MKTNIYEFKTEEEAIEFVGRFGERNRPDISVTLPIKCGEKWIVRINVWSLD